MKGLKEVNITMGGTRGSDILIDFALREFYYSII